MRILVTGAAGFIGYHTAQALLTRGAEVIGLDNLNDYYDVSLKQARLARLQTQPGFRFQKLDLADPAAIKALFANTKPHRVIHLGAQAGVRYSMANPQAYIDSNIAGTLQILEGCRQNDVEHLVFASSSSVYGANTTMPFSVHAGADHPVSLYAATKKSNELMAHVYASLYRLPVTGLRFFTVYGPWGRPDMAYFNFTARSLAGEPIDVYNHGHHARDFTYIDDIVDGILRASDRIPAASPDWPRENPDPSSSYAPYKIYNIGNNQPVQLSYFIETLEKAIGIKAKQNPLPMQPGDVEVTYANIDSLTEDTGFQPQTSIESGLSAFVDWYRAYYKV